MQPAIAELVDELGLPSFVQNGTGEVIFERMSRERAQRYHGSGNEQRSMRLVGGTSALVRRLTQDIAPERIKLNTRATSLELVPQGVLVSVWDGAGKCQQLAADFVIAALPPRLLAETVAFDPPIDRGTAERWRGTPTWMAPHAKFFAIYDSPFWREAGLSGTAQSMVGPMIEMHDATTASGQAALFGFVGVGADQRAAMGKDALTQACIAQFARIFGDVAHHPRSTLLKDWAADGLTSTPADRMAAGPIVPLGVPWVTGQWSGRLALAGSETSTSEPGYLAGAIEAAGRAVGQALAEVSL